ncbi:MAG: Rrf2 family transcriptional regulator [Bacteroidales bacterium]|nr:Rrf2 family transcriptional regulator [Bacteroidales bacterium]
MLSRKTRYAIMALTALARKYGEGPVAMPSIAKEKSIPLRFLEGILLQLRKKGIVDSTRGVEGGYFLVKKPSEVNIAEVVEEMEGSVRFVSCIDLCGEDTGCEFGWDMETCNIRKVFSKIHQTVTQELKGTTLQDLV